MRSQDRTIVVTGASAGVGRAIARRFARDPGARVALLARGRDGLEAARREVEAAGAQALPLVVDVADADAVDAAAETVEQRLGPIDVWVNDAMTTVFAWFEEVTPDEYRRATEVTYLGTVWGTRAALARMLPRDRGTIVQVGSALAYRGIPLQAPYCGAKHAIKGFQESLRCELRSRGSRVHLTMVQLPGVNTPQFEHCRDKLPESSRPVPPVFQPEVAADAVHWAAGHRRRELWVGLPTVRTVLGNRLSPAFTERYLARTAVRSQQTGERTAPGRPDNLFSPVPGDAGAHGPFDAEARRRSPQLSAATHRHLLGAGVASAAAAAALALRRAAHSS
ncbi:SDR family oxidoreductase [Conexibacter arvalis]|uniref:NAD(P)-dependent dehydrogenase (Short-subunit alcohol dehydrogenase family) n=1 Tax=Conexibacter arvalis TaxID=912552 RepID=A0A840ICC8_9ACTN|nr:SDR family oxidoreductase [Conexibacter arvalis]MBB4662382.1 NAD(P)-dependent dehydrogenase (short-subunit alcohol dehydrogenase family) [Conexibacter arvalis]